jgi:hypothetical protein
MQAPATCASYKSYSSYRSYSLQPISFAQEIALMSSVRKLGSAKSPGRSSEALHGPSVHLKMTKMSGWRPQGRGPWGWPTTRQGIFGRAQKTLCVPAAARPRDRPSAVCRQARYPRARHGHASVAMAPSRSASSKLASRGGGPAKSAGVCAGYRTCVGRGQPVRPAPGPRNSGGTAVSEARSRRGCR